MVLADAGNKLYMYHCCLVGNCFSRLEVCLPPRALHLNIFDHEDSVCEKGIWIKGKNATKLGLGALCSPEEELGCLEES